MKKFTAGLFDSLIKMEKYINENNITKEDIVTITADNGVYTLFWYA